MTATSYDPKEKLTLNVLTHIKLNFCNIKFLYVNSILLKIKNLINQKPNLMN